MRRQEVSDELHGVMPLLGCHHTKDCQVDEDQEALFGLRSAESRLPHAGLQPRDQLWHHCAIPKVVDLHVPHPEVAFDKLLHHTPGLAVPVNAWAMWAVKKLRSRMV